MSRPLLASLLALACAAAVPAAAQPASPSEAAPAVPPRTRANVVSLFSDADYPAAALRNGEQGVVSFELAIGVEGRVTGCRVVGSSGSSLLDSTTCAILVRRARFTPARDSSGQPVPDTFAGKIAWRLPSTGPTPPPAPAGESVTAGERAAAAAFMQISALAGTWRNAEAPDSPLRIRFFLTAGGTVVVESWERAGLPHSLTLYHRDGPNLVATHYCPQGNQPRLALSTATPRLRFTFRDATDLDTGESHLHDLSFDLTDRARPVRSETYRQGASEEETKIVLVRVPGPAKGGR